MASVSELIGYTGNADLGLGSNASVPVSAAGDLDNINRTAEMLTMANIAQNKVLFDQKIQDRNKMMEAIDSGDIQVKDLLEEDTPYVTEGLNKLDDAWAEMVKKGPNNIDAQRTYKKALRDAQDRVTQAQARFLGDKEQRVAAANETLPRKQQAMMKNLEGWKKKGFWGEVMPYQQTQDLDIPGSILNTAAIITTPYTDPKTLTKGTRSVFDFGKTLESNKVNFLNDVNKRYDQEQLLNAIQSLDPNQFEATITSMNNRIKEYNDTMGFKPGQKEFVEEIKVLVNPQTGQGVIQERLPDFAAKFTLANQKPFTAGTSEFDKDRASFLLGQERNRIAGINAGANAMKARAYSALQNKKLSQMTEDEKQGNKIWSGIIDRIKTQSITGANNKDIVWEGDIVWAADLPKGYTYIGGLDKNGKPIELKPKVTGKTKFYGTRYTGTDGQDVQKDFLRDKYSQYKEGGGKGDYKNYIKDLLKNGIINLELVGENGTADFETAFQTVRALSNRLSTKGEEPVFGTETIETEVKNE